MGPSGGTLIHRCAGGQHATFSVNRYGLGSKIEGDGQAIAAAGSTICNTILDLSKTAVGERLCSLALVFLGD